MQWFIDLSSGLTLGLGVWLVSWGFNRIYLFVKMMCS